VRDACVKHEFCPGSGERALHEIVKRPVRSPLASASLLSLVIETRRDWYQCDLSCDASMTRPLLAAGVVTHGQGQFPPIVQVLGTICGFFFWADCGAVGHHGVGSLDTAAVRAAVFEQRHEIVAKCSLSSNRGLPFEQAPIVVNRNGSGRDHAERGTAQIWRRSR